MHLPPAIEHDLKDLVFQPHNPYLSLDNRLRPFIDLLLRYGDARVAAERERCAQIADAQYRNAVLATQADGEWARCAAAIAADIRAT